MAPAPLPYTPRRQSAHPYPPSTPTTPPSAFAPLQRRPPNSSMPGSPSPDHQNVPGSSSGARRSATAATRLFTHVRRTLSASSTAKKHDAGYTVPGMFSTDAENLSLAPSSPSTYVLPPSVEEIAMGLHNSRTPHLRTRRPEHGRRFSSNTAGVGQSVSEKAAAYGSFPHPPPLTRRVTTPLPPPPPRSAMKKRSLSPPSTVSTSRTPSLSASTSTAITSPSLSSTSTSLSLSASTSTSISITLSSASPSPSSTPTPTPTPSFSPFPFPKPKRLRLPAFLASATQSHSRAHSLARYAAAAPTPSPASGSRPSFDSAVAWGDEAETPRKAVRFSASTLDLPAAAGAGGAATRWGGGGEVEGRDGVRVSRAVEVKRLAS